MKPMMTSEQSHALKSAIEAEGYVVEIDVDTVNICDPLDNDQGYYLEGHVDDYETLLLDAANFLGVNSI